MLIRTPNGSYESIDFRESAPAKAHKHMYKHDLEGSMVGGLASGVPSELRGLQYLHDNYGVLSWKQVVQPAVEVARYGFPVGEDLVRFMDFFAIDPRLNFLLNDPNWAIDFAPNGTRVGLGDRLTRKRYAATLETIAERGPDAFYEGPLAQVMIDFVQEKGGILSMQDLKEYEVVIQKPLATDYKGFKMHSSPSPASGGIALSIFKILEGYENEDYKDISLSAHRLTEAMRFAYSQRTHLGDPAFVHNLREFQEDMLNSKNAGAIRHRISDAHTLNVSDYNPDGLESAANHGTSHVVTVDKSGLAITLTSTINLIFGSRVMIPETGVIMNDEMDDFSIPSRKNAFGYAPSPANYIRPRARPMSSISPVIVEHASNNSLYFITGAAGGSRIISGTVMSLYHVLNYNTTTAEALAKKRLHDQLIPNVLELEEGIDEDVIKFLESRKHNISMVPNAYSTVHAIRRLVDGSFEAAAEPRQRNSGGFTW
jgi:gamma-glutamyltranspeptidase/glutathione hydrolase